MHLAIRLSSVAETGPWQSTSSRGNVAGNRLGLLFRGDWWYRPLTTFVMVCEHSGNNFWSFISCDVIVCYSLLTSPKQSQRPRLRSSGRFLSNSANPKWEMEETLGRRKFDEMDGEVGKSWLYAHINGNLGKLKIVEIAKSGNVGNRLIVKFWPGP